MRSIPVFAVAAVLCSPTLAAACSCIAPPPPKKALEKAAAVFSAKVTEVTKSPKHFAVTFEIASTWKGTEGKTVTVHTALNSAACGYNFEKGKSYLVYCYKTPKGSDAAAGLWTNICTRTKPMDRAKDDLKELGGGKKP